MMREPDFTNPEGVKWWKDATLTAHAQRVVGDQCSAWQIETPDGGASFVLLEGQEFVVDARNFEAMAVQIDVEAILRRDS